MSSILSLDNDCALPSTLIAAYFACTMKILLLIKSKAKNKYEFKVKDNLLLYPNLCVK